VWNRNGGTESEFSILHTLELGGKRRFRGRVAKLERDSSAIQFLAAKEQAAKDFAIKIYQLRQIDKDLELINENLNTFGRIQRQYKRLGRLSPEQSTSQSLFGIAEQEAKLKKDALAQEREEIISEFSAILGRDLSIKNMSLPALKDDWPHVSLQALSGSAKRQLDGEVTLANARLRLSKANSWPDLSIGPKLVKQTGQTNDTTYGLALSIPIPVLNTNSGGRARSHAELSKAELERRLITQKLQEHADYLLKTYQRSTMAIQGALKNASVERRHQHLHTLLKRGILNPSIVIEMHREVLDFYERLHEHELKAVGALWTIYALNGTLLKEKL
jgi:outer membrane protein TolC